MRTCALLVLAGLTLGFAPFALPEVGRSRGDLKKMNGHWVRIAWYVHGNRVTDSSLTLHVVIAGNRMRCFRAGIARPAEQWTIALDEKQGPPVFDREGTEGAGKAATLRGVYLLKGDVLTVCSRRCYYAMDRPIDFNGEKSWVILEVFKRKKP